MCYFPRSCCQILSWHSELWFLTPLEQEVAMSCMGWGAPASAGDPMGAAAGEGPELEGSEHSAERSDVYLLFSAVGQPLSRSWTGGAKVERKCLFL